MLTTDRERKICERYSAIKADGKVSCHSCPLNKGNPNIYDFRCKANSHYDRRKKEWVTDAEITELAKEVVHKMIDNSDIAEDAYPDLRQRMHEAVERLDEYYPSQNGRGE